MSRESAYSIVEWLLLGNFFTKNMKNVVSLNTCYLFWTFTGINKACLSPFFETRNLEE
jgi:hypothetical protein